MGMRENPDDEAFENSKRNSERRPALFGSEVTNLREGRRCGNEFGRMYRTFVFRCSTADRTFEKLKRNSDRCFANRAIKQKPYLSIANMSMKIGHTFDGVLGIF